ncbi:MAG: glutathione peroxidase [Acidocella sp. 20-63-7]|nr:MAG: glutathione peroxidase [Acidocella sp. 20-63-7]HQT46970.1 glutathione peroxidase [Acidocella sp.]
MTSAYEFSFETLQGQPYPLKALTGRPLMVVNTASECGFTPQYAGLQALWKQFSGAGLVVVGVPCNDFGAQEPGNSEEIAQFCTVNYGVEFPMMRKVHVTGPNAHPFFEWVVEEAGILAKPRWNFFKYLVNTKGELEEWYTSMTKPDSDKVTAAIQKLLYK